MIIILKQCSMRSFNLAFLRSIAILANMEREENCRLIDRWIDIVSCVNPMRRTRPRSLLMVVGGNFDTRGTEIFVVFPLYWCQIYTFDAQVLYTPRRVKNKFEFKIKSKIGFKH